MAVYLSDEDKETLLAGLRKLKLKTSPNNLYKIIERSQSILVR